MKKFLIGYTTIEKDRVMYNNQFSYAASYEVILVKAGKYPIYVSEDDLRKYGDRTVVDGGYYGYTGTVVESNVGGKPGQETRYDLYTYGFSLAEEFLNGYKSLGIGTIERDKMELCPEWGLNIADFMYYDERVLCLELIKKSDAQPIEFN